MKTIAWIILILTLVMFLAMICYLVVGLILFKMFFSRKNIQEKIVKKQMDKQDNSWWNKQKFENVFIKSNNKLKLVGHFLDAGTNKTAILVSGFVFDAIKPYAKFFHDRKFNVFVVENRGCEHSEGGSIGFGGKDTEDILCWIKYLNKKNPNNKILLFGLSVGGTAVCCATGEDLPKNVLCAISDSAFANGKIQIEHIIKNFKPSIKIFKKHLFNFAERVCEIDFKKTNACEKIKLSKIPILIIHGQNDKFVLAENAEKLFENAPKNLKELFIVPDADHCQSYAIAGVKYEKKIDEFLKSRTNF